MLGTCVLINLQNLICFHRCLTVLIVPELWILGFEGRVFVPSSPLSILSMYSTTKDSFVSDSVEDPKNLPMEVLRRAEN